MLKKMGHANPQHRDAICLSSRKEGLPPLCHHSYSLSPIPHIHTHLEMIYMIKGSSKAIVDNKEYLIEPGDIFLAFPHKIHYYNDCTPIEMYLLIFPLDFYKELKVIFQSKIPLCPVIKSTEIHLDLADLMQKILKNTRSDALFDHIVAKGYLLSLLGELLPLMTLLPNDYNHDSIKNVLTYCSQNYTKPLALDTLAKEFHLSKYYISHIFKERMNIGFTDFINSLRIKHACILLEKGSSMTEVAFASGFSTIRTFNRVFVQNIGMSPREYLNKNMQEIPGSL